MWGIKARADGRISPFTPYPRDEVRSVVNIRRVSARSPAQRARLGKRWYIFTSQTRLPILIYPTGHAIVATIAELHLDPSVLPTLCSILDLGSGKSCSIASVASWADEVRNKMRWSEPLHFVNAVADHPPQLCPFPGPKGWEGRQNANVLSAIRNVTDSLTRWVAGGSDQSDPIASEALKFLIHFVGDLHQPLHLAGRARGGNDIYVKWSNRKSRQ